MRTELQRRRRPLTWVAPAGEAEEVSARRAPHARRSALHPAAWHGQQRPTRTRARRGRRRSGRSSHGPRTAGLHFRGVFPASRLPLETQRAGGGTGGTQSRSRPRRAGAAMPRRPQRGKGVRSTTSSPRRAKQTNHLPPPPRRLPEPPWPLGRGARSQQGGRRPGSRSAARAGAPRPRASSPRTGSEAQRLQLVRAENDAGEGVEGKGAGPRVRSRALPGEDQASSVEARTGPGSQPGRVGGPLSALPTAPKEPFCGALPLAG